jgi:hypothetical protein
MQLNKLSIALIVVLSVVSVASAGLDLVFTFDDNATKVWTDLEKDVVNQAVAEWEAAFAEYDIDEVVSFGIDFRDEGGAAAVTYGWGVGVATGMDLRPWQNTGHYMGVLPHTLWWDPTPTTDGDVAGYDALTIIRHELGHMLGSQPGLYIDDIYGPNHEDKWTSEVVGTVFDPGGLNVAMSGPGDLGHTSSGLMKPVMYSGERYDIDLTMDMIAKAFDLQPAVPEPMTMSLLALGGIALLRKRRSA